MKVWRLCEILTRQLQTVNTRVNVTFYCLSARQARCLTLVIAGAMYRPCRNSPILFNIYISDILTLSGLNKIGLSTTSAIAFADDLIIYTAGRCPPAIQAQLESTVEKIIQWYIFWNLKLNPNKCGTIFFRRPIKNLTRLSRAGIKESKIETTIPGTQKKAKIPHKKVSKYLGVHLDY